MTIRAKHKQGQQSVSGTLTGTAPQTATGATLVMATVETGSLSARIAVTATVNTLTLTGKWQVSSNGTDWEDCFPPNNAVQVTIVTGTGSAVSSTRRVEAPDCVYGATYSRYVVVSGVASALGADSEIYAISYSYREHTF